MCMTLPYMLARNTPAKLRIYHLKLAEQPEFADLQTGAS